MGAKWNRIQRSVFGWKGDKGETGETVNIPQRNCVLEGPVNSAGATILFSAGTGLTCDLKSTVRLSFANGFTDEGGASDYFESITADDAAFWSSLPVNSTVQLYIDRDSNGTVRGGYSTLSPVYQSYAPTHSSGLHWFDTNTQKMFVSNGSAWTQVWRVFVGTATTDADSVTGVAVGRYANVFPNVVDDIITKGPWVDVRAFGAVGDGVTDDTAAIQMALDYSGPKTVCLENNKEYLITGSLAVTGKVLDGNYAKITSITESADLIITSGTIRNLTLQGPAVDVRGKRNLIENITSNYSLYFGFQIYGTYEVEAGDTIFRNCKCANSTKYGFLIDGSEVGCPDGEYITIKNVLYENCVAETSGGVKSAAGAPDGATWATGFCVENGLGKGAVENITYLNCRAYDSLESGFHVESGVKSNNVVYISCKSYNNGLRKYARPDIYFGANAITFGAGFLAKNGCKFINCISDGNYRDVFMCAENRDGILYPPNRMDLVDIVNAAGLNYNETMKADAASVLIDSNIRLANPVMMGTNGEYLADYTKLELQPRSLSDQTLWTIDSTNKQIIYNTQYDASKLRICCLAPVPVSTRKKYSLSFDILAQNSSESLAALTNQTFRYFIALYGKDLRKPNPATYYLNYSCPPNSLSAGKSYTATLNDNSTLTFPAGTAYVVLGFMINYVNYSSDSKYDYLAPIIKNICLKEADGIDGSVVWDPASLAAGAGVTSSEITVTGARIGDFVVVSAPCDLQGLTCTAYACAANGVKIRLYNNTSGAIDLASGTWKVKVIK